MTAPALRKDAFVSKLIAFFDFSPDEELTVGDAAAKFGVSEATVRNALAGLGNHGLEFARVIRRREKGIAK